MIKHVIAGIVAVSTIVMGAEISSISPGSASSGTENLTVTFKLSSGSGDQNSSEQRSERSESDESSRGGGRLGGPGGQSGRGGGGQVGPGMLPPANVLPDSVTIGTITGTSVKHSSMDTVTAVFDIPYNAAVGTNTVTITFTDSRGNADVYTSDGFTIE